MVPIFAISSWISLVSLNMAFYVDAFRDIYEAFVIYCFFNLLVCYLGGERSLLVMLHGRPYTKHVWPVSMWSKEMDVGDPYTFLFIKRGILQYVYVKPVLAAVTMLLKSNGAYNDGSISLSSGYFWVSFVYNLSVCLSLYCLGMFFMATHDDLEEFRPIPKFLCVKAVIFFSFWQGFAISVLIAMGIMSNTTPDTAVAIQDFLICFEMVFASVGHWYAFSHKDYTELDIHSARMPIYYATRDASGIKDIIQDSLETLKGTRFTYRTFEPSEGVATVGMSRSGRIMAGLRYTGGGSAKYWLPDANKIGSSGNASISGAEGSGGLATNMSEHQRPEHVRNPNSYSQQVLSSSFQDRAPSLYFADVDEHDDDGMEELYDASKQLEFGDYNFPAIDVYDPKRSKESDRRKMARKNKKKAKQYGEGSSLLRAESGNAGDEVRPLMSESSSGGATFGKSGWDHQESRHSQQQQQQNSSYHVGQAGSGRDKESSSSGQPVASREGCIDNVNGYVPDKKKKKGGVSHAPINTHGQGYQQRQYQQQAAPATTTQNQLESGYDTYGYGYQSYQTDSSASQWGGGYNQGQGSNGQQQQPSPEEEHRGPMFFFL